MSVSENQLHAEWGEETHTTSEMNSTSTPAGPDKDDKPQTAADNDKLVILDWKDVVHTETSESVSQALERAFGANGLGVIAIRNMPGFVAAKQAFLPLGWQLAHLPNDYLETNLTDAESLYNAGWSRGKEKLSDNKPDLAKGSFYYNPVVSQDDKLPGTPEDRAAYPLSYPPNIWPDCIPGFEQKAKHIGCILKQAVVELTKHLDFVAQAHAPHYPQHLLESAMQDTEKVKARLLYYFPLDDTATQEEPAQDSWIGWHNDSGFLTALGGDLYVNHDTGEIVENPDPRAGLYIAAKSQDNNARIVKVHIPPDCLAIQMGECTQIVTGGVFVATPHCVRGICRQSSAAIARISLPCFVDAPPSVELKMPNGCTRQDVLNAAVPSRHVPPLEQRWTSNGMKFGDFLQQTFSLYYDWSQSTNDE